MGRIFETRKHTMFARWDRMAKQFARIGKEIVIAVKAGGPDAVANPLLRRVVQNARAVNMPKDKVESAIKRAAGKEAESYEEILYEGYAPHGVALDSKGSIYVGEVGVTNWPSSFGDTPMPAEVRIARCIQKLEKLQ